MTEILKKSNSMWSIRGPFYNKYASCSLRSRLFTTTNQGRSYLGGGLMGAVASRPQIGKFTLTVAPTPPYLL